MGNLGLVNAIAIVAVLAITAPAVAQFKTGLVPIEDLVRSELPGDAYADRGFGMTAVVRGHQHPIDERIKTLDSGHSGGSLLLQGEYPTGSTGALVFGSRIRAGLYHSRDQRHASGDRLEIFGGHKSVYDGWGFEFQGTFLYDEPAAARVDQKYAVFRGQLSKLFFNHQCVDGAMRLEVGKIHGLITDSTRSIDYGSVGPEVKIKPGCISAWLEGFSLRGLAEQTAKTRLSSRDSRGRDPILTENRVRSFVVQLDYDEEIWTVPITFTIGHEIILRHHHNSFIGTTAIIPF